MCCRLSRPFEPTGTVTSAVALPVVVEATAGVGVPPAGHTCREVGEFGVDEVDLQDDGGHPAGRHPALTQDGQVEVRAAARPARPDRRTCAGSGVQDARPRERHERSSGRREWRRLLGERGTGHVPAEVGRPFVRTVPAEADVHVGPVAGVGVRRLALLLLVQAVAVFRRASAWVVGAPHAVVPDDVLDAEPAGHRVGVAIAVGRLEPRDEGLGHRLLLRHLLVGHPVDRPALLVTTVDALQAAPCSCDRRAVGPAQQLAQLLGADLLGRAAGVLRLVAREVVRDRSKAARLRHRGRAAGDGDRGHERRGDEHPSGQQR